MIISNQKNKTKKQNRSRLLLLVPAAILLLFLFINSRKLGGDSTFICDMEKTIRGGDLYSCGGTNFGNGRTQSSEKVFSGKYSARCDKDNAWGAALELKNVYSGDVFEASVWRQSDDGFGVLALQGDWNFYAEANKAVRTQNGWELIKTKITIPIGVENGSLKIFPYLVGRKGVAYFDDLKVKRTKTANKVSYQGTEYAGHELNIQVDENGFEKLRNKRLQAYSYGNLITGKNDLVPAKLIEGENSVPAHIRLKGDLLDHLRGKKWSFRIIPEKANAWNGMQEFSVHNSLSRSHLNEWIFHQMLQKEGIITTRYDFIKVALNDKILGVYAFEEHFNFTLLDHQKKPRAPIIRMSEDGHWQYAPNGLKQKPLWFESAQIEPFEKKETLKDDQLYEQYQTAQNLLYRFINEDAKVSEVFDIEQLARFIAIQDVCIAHHAFNYTNLRFYFNPTSGLLEPIGYDGYTDDDNKWHISPFMTGAYINSRFDMQANYPEKMLHFHQALFEDLDFAGLYAKHLAYYSSTEYLDEFLKEHLNEIRAREKYIQQEYTSYKFDLKHYFRNCPEVQKVLFPMENISLKAYYSEGKVVLESYHSLPISIEGFGNKKLENPIKEKVVLESFNKSVPVRRYEIPVNQKPKNVFCKTHGTDSLFMFPVFNWAIPQATTPSFKSDLNLLKGIDFINVAGKNINIRSGNHTINQTLIIPSDYSLTIPPGAQLTLTNDAALISYAPILARGTKQNPINIIAKDQAQGVLLLNVKEKSVFENVVFQNLNAIKNGRQFTEGGVTCMASNVDFKRCYFMEIRAKDALHLQDCNYEISDCLFQDINGDALDANYSTGSIKKSIFKNIGKDAIEISGGDATLADNEIDNVLATGINSNFHATVNIWNDKIQKCARGIVAKDLAEITVHNLRLRDIQQGFIAYQDLPDYGGGKIEVKKYEADKVSQLYSAQLGAEIIIDGKKVEEN